MKYSVKNIQHISNTEMQLNMTQYELRRKLGLISGFDHNVSIDEKTFLKVSTLYKSLYEYEDDKLKAYSLISLNKDIPSELYKKLLQTKLELEQTGIL